MRPDHIAEKLLLIDAFEFSDGPTQGQWKRYAPVYLKTLNELETKYTGKNKLSQDLEGILLDMISDFFKVDDIVADVEGFFDTAFAEKKMSKLSEPKSSKEWAGEQALAEMTIVTFLFSKAKATRETLKAAGMHFQSVLRQKP